MMKNDSNEFQINIEEYFFKPLEKSILWDELIWPPYSMMIILYYNANTWWIFIVSGRNSKLIPFFD